MNLNMTKRQNITLLYISILVPIVTFIEKPHIDFHYKVIMYVLIYIIVHVDLDRKYKKEMKKEKRKKIKDNIENHIPISLFYIVNSSL